MCTEEADQSDQHGLMVPGTQYPGNGKCPRIHCSVCFFQAFQVKQNIVLRIYRVYKLQTVIIFRDRWYIKYVCLSVMTTEFLVHKYIHTSDI